VGAVERTQLMPHIDQIQDGDLVIGLPSTGVHSNGFSLVRNVMKLAGVGYQDQAPFSKNSKSFGKYYTLDVYITFMNQSFRSGQELLTPTKIYVKSVIKAVETGKVKAFAHITGGGLTENIPRVLPESLGVELDSTKWQIPEVFSWLATTGGVSQQEMLRYVFVDHKNVLN